MPTYANRIRDLTAVLAAPAAPLDADPAVLARNRDILYTELPDDFVEFARVYGSGQIETAYTWEVWSPARPTYPLLVLSIARSLEVYRDAAEVTGVPFGIFPAVGGFLPFARASGGDLVGWLTQGEPNTWKVIDLHRYSPGLYDVHDMGFSEYFFKVITRELVLRQHSDDWGPDDVAFDPVVFADRAWIGAGR